MKNISGWKKVIIIISLFNVLALFINFVLLSFYGIQIKVKLAWILGSEDKIILSNLLFFEGALIIGIGALLAGGFAENRMHRTNVPSTPYVVEKMSKQRSNFRDKQISTGFLLILAGLPLIIMSVLSFIS